jgi:Domain of unknown function (DUF4516)
MPAGVSWPTYLKFFAAAFVSMALGAQVVHQYYKPLNDLEMFVENELKKQDALVQNKK